MSGGHLLAFPGTRVRVSVYALAVLVMMLCAEPSVYTMQILLAAAVHECGHLAVMRACGVTVYRLDILACGAEISSDAAGLPPGKEALAALGGILAGLAAAGLLCFYGTYLVKGSRAALFGAFVNVVLSVVNALPLPTFDGYRALSLLVGARFAEPTASHVMEWLSYGAFVALTVVTLILVRVTHGNLSFLAFYAYVFASLYGKGRGA